MWAVAAGWTGLIGAGLRVRLQRRIVRLGDSEYWRRQTARMQVAQLRGLLAHAQGTRFGREHGFGRLARLADADLVAAYRGAVPVAGWEGYRGLIARMREGGEPDVLWPGLVMDFAQTSGTTAGEKYIPVSRAMMRSNYRAAMDVPAHLARSGVPLSRVFAGKWLFLGGSTALDVNRHGIRTGDLSALVTGLIRWPFSRVYLPGREIALMSDWGEKIEAMARGCVDEDVRMVSGFPSWAVVLFERVLEIARERAPAQAGGPRHLKSVWPNLEVFIHAGVRYAPFEPRVRRLWSGSVDGEDIRARLEIYAASEGFIAIQDEPNRPGSPQPALRLNTDIGLFFEFVPLERIDDPNPPAFAAHEVEKGQRYVLVLTTCAGLWRYNLGDVVEFESVPARAGGRGGDGPARLRIVGRHRHFLNAFGENLVVENVESAVVEAARASGVVVGEFTAAPVYPRDGAAAAIELAAEVEGAPPAVLASFAAAFDESLKRQSVGYAMKRSGDVGMGPPIITPLPTGAFHRWLAGRGRLGGQHKCPRCANERGILEEVVRVGQEGRLGRSLTGGES